LDLVFGKLVCEGYKVRRVLKAEMPPCGFEIGLEILPVCDMESLEVCWDTFYNARSNFGDLEIVSTQC
jgi:hypothetical protein